MKKLLAVLALALLASPAYATIVNTAHDLSNGTEELCAYCHTPHAAYATSNAPLWNRDLSGITMSSVYSSTTFNGGAIDYSGTDVTLCLSCHDGSLALTAVVNQPNSGNLANPGGAALDTNTTITGATMTNDHPVGFVYATAAADAEINTPAFGGAFRGTLGSGGKMQCSSCHDVHNDSLGSPFLVQTNAQSALCIVCHDK